MGKKSHKTDKDALEWEKENGLEMYHPIGSCSMQPEDKGGIVNSALRVYGTQNVMSSMQLLCLLLLVQLHKRLFLVLVKKLRR